MRREVNDVCAVEIVDAGVVERFGVQQSARRRPAAGAPLTSRSGFKRLSCGPAPCGA